MSLNNRCPTAHRALAFMLCCVLVFALGVPTAPRAAAIVDGTSAVEIVGGPHLTVIEGGTAGGAGAAASGASGATIGAFLLAACGINMMVDSIEYSTTRYSGGTPYEKGNELWAYLYDLGGDIADWCITGAPSGSINPGDTFTVPAEVLEAARAWAVDNFDFVEGICTYDEHALNDGDCNFFVLSDVDTAQIDSKTSYSSIRCSRRHLGSLAYFHFGDPSESYEFRDYVTDDICFVSTYELTENSSGSCSYRYFQGFCLPGRSGVNTSGGRSGSGSFQSKDKLISSMQSAASSFARPLLLAYSSTSNRLYCGTWNDYYDCVYFHSHVDCSAFPAVAPVTFGTTFTKTDILDQPKTEDITITIPQELPTTQVGELTIPVITEITSTDLTEAGGEKDPSTDPQPGTGITPGQITEAVKDALPVTGSQLGDDVLEETLGEPDTLGGILMTKFPFSIPWDIARAIELLAAPPVTPRWEMDFMAPIGERIGGFQGDTTVVIDFGEYEIIGIATRWFSTIMFVYGLAAATKRFMWPS